MDPGDVSCPFERDHQLRKSFFWGRKEPKNISVADPGCLSWIPDPSQRILSILIPKKLFLSSRNYTPVCSSRIRIPDPDPDFLRIPDPGNTGML
jgi:hypothetical protein